MRGRRLRWVNRVISVVGQLLPVFPWKRTSSGPVAMSQRCQQETYASQQIASYSITSSARATSVGGTTRPRALAVFILITSSNLVGISTGRSAGLAPLRTFPA